MSRHILGRMEEIWNHFTVSVSSLVHIYPREVWLAWDKYCPYLQLKSVSHRWNAFCLYLLLYNHHYKKEKQLMPCQGQIWSIENNMGCLVIRNRQPAEDWQTFPSIQTRRLWAAKTPRRAEGPARIALQVWEGVRRARRWVEHRRLVEAAQGLQVAHVVWRGRRRAHVSLNVSVVGIELVVGIAVLSMHGKGSK